jgi:uncharacterized protein YbjT (DUF2867 family)
MNEANAPKTAIISGASGLVGTSLLSMLLADDRYGKIISVARKPLGFTHEKLVEHIVDFGMLPQVFEGLAADHGYCCLGTTIKTAGSKERQYTIDHDYVVDFAQGCLGAGVTRFTVVSSIGADAASSNFYLRTKGEMERDLKTIPFRGLCLMQPSLLMGDRKEHRTGEKTASAVMNLIAPLMVGRLKKYRGVSVSSVAATMIREMWSGAEGVITIPSDQIR